MKARAILLALLLGIVAMLWNGPAQAAASDPLPAPTAGRYTDKRLYRDIAAEVAKGATYYAAAAQLQRSHRYPLKPGVTVRLPTLTLAAVAIGWEGLRAIAFVLLGGTALAWFLALRGKVALWERLAAAAAILASAGMLTGDPMILHERWAGLLLGVALALRVGSREAWVRVLIPAAIALSLRELALPFVLLALAAALVEKRLREAAAWSALVAAFAVFVAWHLHLVAAQVRPGDLATQGWAAFGGLFALSRAIAFTSPLQYLPALVAVPLALLPLLGWLGLPGRAGLFCFALFAGYALMIALFPRPDNFYWGAIVQPAWFVGLAFLPRATTRAWRAVRRRGNLAGVGAAL